MIYILIAVVIYFSAICYEYFRVRNYNILYFLVFVIAVFVGGRYDVGTDWVNYLGGYEKASINTLEITKEPLFSIIMYLCKSFGFSYQFFLFIVSLISTLAVLYSFKRFGIKNLYIPLSIYFCIFFCQCQLNIIRQGVMIPLVWIAFSYVAERKFKFFIIWLLLAAGFHYTALLFIPAYWIYKIRISFSTIVKISAILLAIWYFNLSQTLWNLLLNVQGLNGMVTFYIVEYYEKNSQIAYGLSLGVFLNLFIVLVSSHYYKSLYTNKELFKIAVNLLLISFIITAGLNEYALFVERLAKTTNYATCIVISGLILNSKKYKGILYIGLLIYLSLYLYMCLSTPGVVDSGKALQFLPYHFRWLGFEF